MNPLNFKFQVIQIFIVIKNGVNKEVRNGSY